MASFISRYSPLQYDDVVALVDAAAGEFKGEITPGLISEVIQKVHSVLADKYTTGELICDTPPRVFARQSLTDPNRVDVWVM